MKNLWRLLLAIAVITGVIVAAQRIRVENKFRQVEVAVDYNALDDFARLNGYDLNKLLKSLKRTGVATMAVSEQTMDELQRDGDVTVYAGQEIIGLNRLGQLISKDNSSLIPSGIVSPQYTYVFSDTHERIKFLEQSIRHRFGKTKARVLKVGNKSVLEVRVEKDLLKDLKLGLPYSTMQKLDDAGFYIAPRLTNYPQIDTNGIKQIIKQLNDRYKISAFIFEGPEVFGYPNRINNTAKELNRYKNNLGIIEFFPQKGMDTLARMLDNRLIRVHSMGAKEMEKKTPDYAIERYVRAVRERNIRIVYMRPFIKLDKPGDIWKLNLNYFNDVIKGLKAYGYTIGPAKGLLKLKDNTFTLLLLFVGMAAGIALLAEYMGIKGIWMQAVIPVFAYLCLSLLYLKGYGLIARRLAALAVGVTFPALAALQVLRSKDGPKFWRNVFRDFGKVLLFSVCGGLLIASILANWFFMIKLKQFFGVKLVHIVPIFFTALALYIHWYKLKGKKADSHKDVSREVLAGINNLLYKPILVIYVIGAGIIGLAGLIYILRTGNETGLPSLAIERKMRDLLDTLLYVRPRTKEFLIGHPAMLLGIAFYYWKSPKYYIPLILIGLIGEISIVDTFAHIHTPLLLTLLRVFNGIWLGSLIGAVLIYITAKFRARRSKTI